MPEKSSPAPPLASPKTAHDREVAARKERLADDPEDWDPICIETVKEG